MALLTRTGWQLDLAGPNSLATKTFTGSYGKVGYGAEGLSMAGPLLLDAPVTTRSGALPWDSCPHGILVNQLQHQQFTSSAGDFPQHGAARLAARLKFEAYHFEWVVDQ